jgi:hypothetical protein
MRSRFKIFVRSLFVISVQFTRGIIFLFCIYARTNETMYTRCGQDETLIILNKISLIYFQVA